MIEHHEADKLKVENRTPSGGKIKAMRCRKCNNIAVSNRPGDPYECKCGFKTPRTT